MKKQNTITIALGNKGFSFRDIAGMTGFSAATVYAVVNRKNRNLILQDVIAGLLGEDPEILWGLDYHPRARKFLASRSTMTLDRFCKHYTIKNPSTLGDRIRNERYRQKMSLDDLADRTGIDKSALSHYETGDRKPNQKSCELIGFALGISPDWIVFADEGARPAEIKNDTPLAAGAAVGF